MRLFGMKKEGSGNRTTDQSFRALGESSLWGTTSGDRASQSHPIHSLFMFPFSSSMDQAPFCSRRIHVTSTNSEVRDFHLNPGIQTKRKFRWLTSFCAVSYLFLKKNQFVFYTSPENRHMGISQNLLKKHRIPLTTHCKWNIKWNPVTVWQLIRICTSERDVTHLLKMTIIPHRTPVFVTYQFCCHKSVQIWLLR